VYRYHSSHAALEKPLTQQQQGLGKSLKIPFRKIPPPPPVGNISQYHLGKKYESGKRKKGENVTEKERKGKENEKMGSKCVK
jgi:hypothetical protein